MGSSEKKYLANLSKTIEDYCETEQISSLAEIYQDFGKPQTVIISYLETVDTSLLIKKIQLTKWIKRGLAFFLLLALVFTSVFGITTYKEYKTFIKEQIFFEEETIE